MPEISNDEVRYKILQVLYETATKSADWRVQRSYLKTKLNLDEKQIDFNLLYLDSRKLAQVTEARDSNWEQVRITGKGIDVYEHKLKFVDRYPFIQVAIQNIEGAVSGNAVQSMSTVNITQITDAFNNAFSIVKSEPNVPEEKRKEVIRNLEALQEELKKEKPNLSKAKAIWTWLKNNANWIVPTLKDIVETILKT